MRRDQEHVDKNTIIAFNTHGCLDDKEIFPPIKEDFTKYVHNINVKNGELTCHLLDVQKYEDGGTEDVIDMIMGVNAALSNVFKLGSKQKVALRKAIEKTVEQDRYRVDGIRAVGKNLLNQNSSTAEGVYDKLYCLFGHNIFRDGDLFAEPGKINVVDLGHLDGDTQIIVIELVLSYLWRLAMGGQLKDLGDIYIFIDEVQNISFSTAGMLSLLLSEGRKFNMNLILATQLLNYNTTNPTQRKMLQAGLVVYFKPADNDRTTMAAMISGNDKERWSMELASLGVGEFVVSGPILIGDVESRGPVTVSGRDENPKMRSENKEKTYPQIKVISRVEKNFNNKGEA